MDQTEHRETAARKEVTFRRLSLQALPEMWTFQLLAGILLAIPAALLMKLIGLVSGAGGDVFTTADIRSFVLSWRFPVILFLGIVLVMIYLVFELLSQIFLTDDILGGRRAGIKKCIGRGFRSVKRFLNPGGIGFILFILFAVPLCGAGFSLSLSSSFRIPNFIMDVIQKNRFFAVGYAVLIVFLIWRAFRWAFTLHAVLLDGMKPSEGMKYSNLIVKEHRWAFLKGLILTGIVIVLVIAASFFLFNHIPGWILGGFGETLPKDYRIDFMKLIRSGGISDLDLKIILYRTAAAFTVLIRNYMVSVVILLCSAYFLLRLGRYYLEYTGRGGELWPERPKKSRYIWKIILILSMFVLFFFLSLVIGLFYDSFFTRAEPVKIIVHRTGGTMASENSLEGLEKSIGHGCYGCETDIQRTKDGFYIINHDDTFERLAGVDKEPKDMTLEEIRKLRIKDTTGNGQEHQVPTLEEMLDIIRGRIRLFVELKGKTADRQMVDDAVRIIKEHDCVEDTVLISLKYDLIKYAETTYPEFDTGVLFFASLGDISELTCDYLIMEVDNATDENTAMIHDAGKQAVAWTVDEEDDMYHFLDSEIDAVITDEVELAQEVQNRLDERTDLEVLKDRLSIGI